MRAALIALFGSVLAAMLWVTTAASLDQSVLVAAREIWADPWSRATLFDAYFGFLVVYVWIFCRKKSPVARTAWLVLLMAVGSSPSPSISCVL